MNARDLQRLGVAVNHVDPLLAIGLEAALQRESDMEVHRAQRWDALDVPVQVIVTDYQTAMQFVVRESRRGVRQVVDARVMVVTGNDREHDVRAALERGVDGYLLLGCSLEEVVNGVRSLGKGMRYVCPSAARLMAESLAYDALTPRESEVLRHLARGTSDKVIARQLDITLGTVKTHVRSILEKLDARCRTEAARIATERGLIDWGRPSHSSGHEMRASGWSGSSAQEALAA